MYEIYMQITCNYYGTEVVKLQQQKIPSDPLVRQLSFHSQFIFQLIMNQIT